MATGRMLRWGTLAATLVGVVYFWGDLQRYVKMRML
jgi:hypothetical protein